MNPVDADELSLLVDLHGRQARQGPGSDDQTRKAVDLAGLRDRSGLRIADVGCGTGSSTMVLAELPDSVITAVDMVPAFLSELNRRAVNQGCAERVSTVEGQLQDLPFTDGSLDVIWAEGAIYSIGFSAGVQNWWRFLTPGGVLAVSEITWLTDERPLAIEEFWTAEYPEIGTASQKFAALEAKGYSPLGYFTLPPRCWWEEYYRPLAEQFEEFLTRHPHSESAQAIVSAEREEMELFDAYGAWYGYGFYIARRVP